MKKLMLTAAVAAMATGVLAQRPAVYDYKATVKHLYIKEVNVSVFVAGGTKQQFKIYQKYQKSSSLKGYLIHDVNGATSAAAHAGYRNPTTVATSFNGIVPTQRQWVGPALVGAQRANDQVNHRAFLVVMNTTAEAQVRQPKILPAIFDAKFLDTAYKTEFQWPAIINPIYTSGIAEGNLFVGGDLGAGLKDYLRDDRDDENGINPSVAAFDYVTGAPDTAAGQIAARGMILDYGWTSVYLFGKYNGANGATVWRNWQAAAEAVQTVPGYAGTSAGRPVGSIFFHDAWMNGVGLGKYAVADDSEDCCGFSIGGINFNLDTLAGKLKGGVFLCSENGYTVTGYNKLAGLDWEDQFWNEKAFGGYTDPVGLIRPTYVPFAGPRDRDQEDVWVDGDLELLTTDVLDGDWSIKFLTSTRVPYEALTDREIRAISNLGPLAANESYASTFSRSILGAGENSDLDDLNAVIKGCALNLKPDLEFMRIQSNGATRMIPACASQLNNDRFTVPFIDSNFARAYGLGSYCKGVF